MPTSSRLPSLPRWCTALSIALLASAPLRAASTLYVADLSKIIAAYNYDDTYLTSWLYIMDNIGSFEKKYLHTIVPSSKSGHLWVEYPASFYGGQDVCINKKPFKMYLQKSRIVPVPLHADRRKLLVSGYWREQFTRHPHSDITLLITAYLPRLFSDTPHTIDVHMHFFRIQVDDLTFPMYNDEFFVGLSMTRIEALRAKDKQSLYKAYAPEANDHIVYNVISNLFSTRNQGGNTKSWEDPDLLTIYNPSPKPNATCILDCVTLRIASPSTSFLQDCTIEEIKTLACGATITFTVILALRRIPLRTL